MATTLTTSAPRKAAPAAPILSAGRIRRLGPALERAPLFRDRIRHRPGPRSLSRRRSRPRRARRMAGLRGVDRPGVPPTRPAPPPSTARSRAPIWRRCCGWRASIGATCEAAPPAASSPSHIRVIDDTKDDVPLDEFAATDLLVSVDTIAAHCAGALGHKLFFAGSLFSPLVLGSRFRPNPWYPTAEFSGKKRRGIGGSRSGRLLRRSCDQPKDAGLRWINGRRCALAYSATRFDGCPSALTPIATGYQQHKNFINCRPTTELILHP
jgi:hypothetical protein